MNTETRTLLDVLFEVGHNYRCNGNELDDRIGDTLLEIARRVEEALQEANSDEDTSQ